MVIEVKTAVSLGKEGGVVGEEGHKKVGSVPSLACLSGNTGVFTLVIIELWT